MKLQWIMAAAAGIAAAPGFAAGGNFADIGDPEAGKSAFSQCQACHVVVDEGGNTLAGRTAKTGPNLYGMIGRQAGTVEGFRYSKSIVLAGEQGLIWDADTFVAYVQDPTNYLREVLGDSKARGRMAFKVRKPEDAANLYALIRSLGPSLDD